jgi:ribosome recycling factor
MRGLCKVGLALGLAVLLCGPAAAQPPGAVRLPGFLLLDPTVQEELKLDKEQIQKVRMSNGAFIGERRGDLVRLQAPNLTGEERRRLARTVLEDNMKAVTEGLKPGQAKRFKQIWLQQEGLTAFDDPEVQKALKLTDKQRDEITALGAELAKQAEDIYRSARANRQEAFQKIASLRKEKLDSALKVLTGEQRKAWKEMTGEHFELPGRRP